MTRHSICFVSTVAVFNAWALMATGPALAAGSGGGGGGYSAPSESAPKYDPAVEYRKGIVALQAKDFKAAKTAFDRVLSVAPRDANSNLMAGMARAGLDDWKAAQKLFEKAVKLDDTSILANHQLGIAHARGRAAFRTPMLLGGQAARAGLSCASCHRNGRDNQDFFLMGLSSPPGTADVTSSLMSKSRGDALFNPKLIPDLADGAATQKISRDARSGDLERFLTGQIVEEFDGHAPPPRVLAGLAAYVRATRRDACPGGGDEPVTVSAHLDDAEAATNAARDTDAATARLMLSSARWTLGRIDERYTAAELAAVRVKIRAADRGLANIQVSLDGGELAGLEQIDDWQRMFAMLRPAIESASARSLFNPARLSRLSR